MLHNQKLKQSKMENSSFHQLLIDRKKSIIALVKDIIGNNEVQWPVNLEKQPMLQLTEGSFYLKNAEDLKELKNRYVSVLSYAYNHSCSLFKNGQTTGKTFLLNHLNTEMLSQYEKSTVRLILR